MLRSKFGATPKGMTAAIILLAPLLATGCTLVQPGCRNRDVKAAIEQDALESLNLLGSTSGLPVAPTDAKVSLVDQVEIARHDNTRSCTANVAVGIGSASVSVPIEYVVTVGADNEALYQWDKYGFGQKLVGTTLMSALLDMAHGKQPPPPEEETAHQPEGQPDTTTAPETSSAATPSPQGATAPSDVMKAWQKGVRSEIGVQVKKLIDMPRGKQLMRFRIGPDGEITAAKAVEPVENPQLADRLVQFLNGLDPVMKPPLGKVVWIEITLSF